MAYIYIPRNLSFRLSSDDHVFPSDHKRGLEVRQYMAMHILEGILASGEIFAPETKSRYSVYLADCLIHALNMAPQEIHDEFNPQQTNE